MSKQKNRRVNHKTQKKQQEGAILPFITGLCIGLFIAFVVYLKMPHQADQQSNSAATDESSVSVTDDGGTEDKPKFDFYTILPEREVKVPEWEPPEIKHDSKTPESTKSAIGAYVFQVGSFQQYSDADSVKARLTMLGFPVEIQRVVINGQKVWFRVRVGPYDDQDKLNSVRQRLSQNNMDYILLRIKDESE